MSPRQGVHIFSARVSVICLSPRASAHRSVFPNRMSSGSSTITEFGNTLFLGTMLTTEESPFLLKAVSDNSDTTCRTDRCERVDRALKAIVGVNLSVLGDLECFVVIVSASFTFGHGITAPEVLALSIRLIQRWHNKFPL